MFMRVVHYLTGSGCMYLPSYILLLYVCLEAAQRNLFSEDVTEAQFGTFAQKWQ